MSFTEVSCLNIRSRKLIFDMYFSQTVTEVNLEFVACH